MDGIDQAAVHSPIVVSAQKPLVIKLNPSRSLSLESPEQPTQISGLTACKGNLYLMENGNSHDVLNGSKALLVVKVHDLSHSVRAELSSQCAISSL